VSSGRGTTRQQQQQYRSGQSSFGAAGRRQITAGSTESCLRFTTSTTAGTTGRNTINNNGRWQNVKTESFTTSSSSSSSSSRAVTTQQHQQRGEEGGGTYEERRERIERRAIEESRAAKRRGRRDDGNARRQQQRITNNNNNNNNKAADNNCHVDDKQEEEDEDIQSLLSWVGPLIVIDDDGRSEDDDKGKKDDDDETKKQITQYSCTYYQDRDKRYPFTTDKRGFNLLTYLMITNRKLLHINRCMIEKFGTTATTITGSDDNPEELFVDDDDDDNNNNDDGDIDDDAMDIIIRIGQGLYAHKPTLRTKGVTWSTEEYSHPGLQRMYLRMKSIQRFTEIWSLLERAEALGVFDDIFGIGGTNAENNVIRIAAVGGGPGYELLATKLFFEDRAPPSEEGLDEIQLELTCMDVCPAWRAYAEALGFKFVDYDIDNESGISPLEAMGLETGQLHFCIVSCVMIYVTNSKVMSMFHKLIHNDGVKAMLISERGERTMACSMMEALGGKVIRLIDQVDGMDERQAIWSSQEFCDEQLRTCYPDYEAHQSKCVFPNVPYCEHKERRRSGGSGRYKR